MLKRGMEKGRLEERAEAEAEKLKSNLVTQTQN